ncbi:MAG: hypothetical protein Kow00103_11980 [Candidatus Caldatribacteriota bacterium]
MLINFKYKKRLIYWLVIPIFTLLVIVGVLYIYINTENFREDIKSILLTQLETNLGLNIEIGTLKSISFQSLQLNDIVVFEGNLSKENILFQAEEIKAKFNLFFSLLDWKNWQLDIQEITFYRASLEITRERNGEFDLFNKLKLQGEENQQRFFIARLNFQDSMLTFYDKLVYNYNQDALTTEVNDIQGYFDLSQFPEIFFDFKGRELKGNALLTLQGKIFINKPEYSLAFHLENADILHFQYYIEPMEQLNITQGKFNLALALKSPPEGESVEALWQGEANFQQVSIQLNRLEGIYFEDISGSIQFTKPEIKISQLKGFYQGSPISVQGVLIIEPEVYFDFDLTTEKLDISRVIEDISLYMDDYNTFPLQGNINLSGNIKGEIDDFQIEAKISSPEIKIDDIAFQNIDCSFFLNRDTLFINSLNLQDAEASITLNGKIDWSGDIPFYQFFLETKRLSLQHSLFNHFSFLKDTSGQVIGKFQIESDKKDSSMVKVEGQFETDALKIKEISFADSLQGKIKSVIYLSDNYITINQGELIFKQNRGSLSGKINYSDPINFDLYFEALVPEIDELFAFASLKMETIPTGNGEIKGTFTGNLKNPEISAEFSLQDFSLQDFLWDEIKGKLAFHQNTIYLEELGLKNKDINLSAKGDIVLQESGSPKINLFYQFEPIALYSLTQTLKVAFPLSGQVAGSGNLQGIWPGWALKGSFQLEQIIYDGYPFGKGQIVFNLKPEQTLVKENLDNLNNNLPKIFSWLSSHSYSFNLEKFVLQNETVDLSIFGKICMGENNQFSGEIDFSHQNLPEMVEYFYPLDNDNNNLKVFLPNRITGKAKLEGDHFAQQLTLSTQFTLPQQEDKLPTKLESVIKKDKQGFTISKLSLIQPGGHFKLEGNISSNQELDLAFQAEELDLNTLMSLTQNNEIIKGIINIKGSCMGTINQPEVFLSAQIKEGYFREFNFTNLQSNLYWDSKTNIIEVKDFVVALKQDYRIQAKGNLPLDVFSAFGRKKGEVTTSETLGQGIPLNFQIKMDHTDIKILRLFWKDAFSEISGFIDVELNLTGTSRKPSINGMIEVRQGKINLVDLPVKIGELNTRIEISNNRVIIPPVQFTIYDHFFNLSGQLELNNFLPDHVLITIDNKEKKIVYQNIIESGADLWVEIKGSFLEPEIKGQLVLSEGNLNLDKLQGLLGEKGLGYSTLTVPGDLRGKLDINIEIAEPFSLRLPNSEIFVAGKINLKGVFPQPNIQGNILLKRGNFIYFEKKFEIYEGHISINGFTVNDIEINARAQTKVQNVRILIYIYGSLANPQIRLSSEPPLLETEIISLLTLGRNIEGLSRGEIDQLLSQEIVNIIFQSLQENILKRIEREIAGRLGLDLLRLSVDNLITSDNKTLLFEGLNLADLTLEVGKNIGEKFFITYKTPMDFQGEKSMGIDYKLSSTFSFNTQLDTYSFSLKENNYRLKFGLEFNF